METNRDAGAPIGLKVRLLAGAALFAVAAGNIALGAHAPLDRLMFQPNDEAPHRVVFSGWKLRDYAGHRIPQLRGKRIQ